jgi:hypothetical protein
MTAWISATDAFAIVVSHEVAPDVAYEKILAAIKDKKLPARARMVNFDGEDYEGLEVLPMSFWEVTDASIDFKEATARSIHLWGSGLSLPATIENVRDLEFSEPHLFRLWPKVAEPSQGDQRAMKVRGSAADAVKAAFPNGIPTRLQMSNVVLCKKVREHLPKDWVGHDHTIERAAARRK